MEFAVSFKVCRTFFWCDFTLVERLLPSLIFDQAFTSSLPKSFSTPSFTPSRSSTLAPIYRRLAFIFLSSTSSPSSICP